MKIATAANARTANAAHHSLNKGLKVAFSAGSVMGFTVVGLGLLDTSIWFYILKMVYGDNTQAIASALVTFGMGASTMALFARVGGGIFTKLLTLVLTWLVKLKLVSQKTTRETLQLSLTT